MTVTLSATPPGPPRRPLFVGMDEAARLVALSRRTLDRWIKAGELPVRRIGRRVLVKPTDLAEVIEGRRAPAGP